MRVSPMSINPFGCLCDALGLGVASQLGRTCPKKHFSRFSSNIVRAASTRVGARRQARVMPALVSGADCLLIKLTVTSRK